MKRSTKALVLAASLGTLWLAARILEPLFVDMEMPSAHAPTELFEILRECDRYAT